MNPMQSTCQNQVFYFVSGGVKCVWPEGIEIIIYLTKLLKLSIFIIFKGYFGASCKI